MNKREFVAGGLAVAIVGPVLARPAELRPGAGALRDLMTRTQRLPDLAERPGADAFEAYVGERFDIIDGPGSGEQLVLESVERVSHGGSGERFNVVFVPALPGAALVDDDGVRVLRHATGQRVILHLERNPGGYAARFNLLV